MNLWLTDTEEYYREMHYIITYFETVDEQVEELEQYVRFLAETDESGSMTSDLLSTALGRVSWYGIVESNQD